MPGNEPEADDLEALANQGAETTSDPSQGGTTSDPILDALKPSGHAEGQTQQKPTPTTDYQKRYEAMRPEFDKRSQKLKSLESLVTNPEIQKLAQTNPALAQALAKAGYKLAEEQAQEDGGGAADDEEYWHTPEGRQDVMEAKAELRYEMEDFAMQALGRRFNATEQAQVKSMIAKAGALTVEEAWSITPAAKAMRLAGEQKRLSEVQARGGRGGSRPRPTPNALGGGAEKIDLKKHPSQFSDAEKREFLSNLPQ